MSDPTLLDAMNLCGLTGPTWAAWRCVAKCIDGQGATFTRDEAALYEACTHRTQPPTEPPAEVFGIVGRRGGKSRFAGAVAVRAAIRQYATLAPGETAIVAVAASDREQARVVHQYATAPFRDPALAPLIARRSAWATLRALVTRETRSSIDLSTGVSIEVHTSHFGRIRGRTFALAIADETAFWQAEDGTNPASEVLNSIRPGLATLNGQLLVISSPFAKAGPLWDTYTASFGKDDPAVLVWQAPSRVMNPSLSQSVVDPALARDETAARAEWLAEFRDDLGALVTDIALHARVQPDLPELAWQPDC